MTTPGLEVSLAGEVPATFLPTLEAAVNLRVAELVRRGGPADADFTRLREVLADRIAGGADVLFRKAYPGEKGKFGEMFRDLTDALSVMAFCPGGVAILGLHFQATAH